MARMFNVSSESVSVTSIRFEMASPRDAKTIAAECAGFIAADTSGMMKQRDIAELIQAIADQSCFLARDPSGRLVATAFSFQMPGNEMVEFGATRASLRGYGFQGKMLALRIANERTKARVSEVFSVTRSDNSVSIRHLQAAGFIAAAPPETFLSLGRAIAQEFPDELTYFRLPQATIARNDYSVDELIERFNKSGSLRYAAWNLPPKSWCSWFSAGE